MRVSSSMSFTVCAVQTLSPRFVTLGVQQPPAMNGAAILSSSFLFGPFCFAVCKFVWCSSVTTPAPENLLHHELRRREKVGSLHDRALFLFPYFGVGILVLEQTNAIATDVSSSQICVAMFTLDLVRVQETRKPPQCLDL